jgi:hypothetical protein
MLTAFGIRKGFQTGHRRASYQCHPANGTKKTDKELAAAFKQQSKMHSRSSFDMAKARAELVLRVEGSQSTHMASRK